ncbi:MAG: hypothetical protein LBE24_10715 [Methylobacillus sp.]|jgi:hypothetical protein|nr:hypothetical protein [Methylobacillus sp.]
MADFQDTANVISTLADAGKKSQRGKDPVPEADRAGSAIGQSTGSATAGGNSAERKPSGIASPLTETDVNLREYYEMQDTWTEDGTLVRIKPVKTMYMKDALGAEVQLNFGLPSYDSEPAP